MKKIEWWIYFSHDRSPNYFPHGIDVRKELALTKRKAIKKIQELYVEYPKGQAAVVRIEMVEPLKIERKVVPHIAKGDSREHVVWWDANGSHCTEPDCEINRRGK